MIRLIISDFDGTLVDTFEANLRAYQKAFNRVGLYLAAEEYRRYFGYRFERFMMAMAISDENVRAKIRESKKELYPQYFRFLKPNNSLIELITTFRSMGGKTAIASTARKENLMNAINYLCIADKFDLILSGIDVKQGKPSPEIYNKTMEKLGVSPEETLIFEDSDVGVQAAKASGAMCIVVNSDSK